MRELLAMAWETKLYMDNFWTETFRNFIATIYSDGSINWFSFACWGGAFFGAGWSIASTIEHFKPRR